ncbi:MAG: hypothetical protein LBR70_02215 [Lactobacillaceae bacterium]|jgi:hypothetical protein|nr:hypothetical protein [Lactobacillaceae bacterium]
MTKNKVSIPFGEMLARSLIYTAENMKLLFKGSGFWLSSALLLSWLGVISAYGDENSCFFTVIWVGLTLSSLSVYCFRYILLNEKKLLVNVSLGKREFKFFAVFLILIGVLSLPIFFGLIRVFFIYRDNMEGIGEIFYWLIFTAVFYAVVIRSSFILPSIAVCDKGIGLKEVIRLTKGSSFKIFCLFAAEIIIAYILYLTALNMVNVFSFNENARVILNTALCYLTIYFTAYMLTILYAHVYQYLRFQKQLKAL